MTLLKKCRRVMRQALLILDPQNDFFDPENPLLSDFRQTIPVINTAIATFRKQNQPVIFIQHTSQKKPPGSHSWEIYSEFDCRPEDARIRKSHINAFWDSDLDNCLKSLQIDFIVIAGYIAEYCVLSSYRGALERGYNAAILKDGIASVFSDDRTRFVLEISKQITIDELNLKNTTDHETTST